MNDNLLKPRLLCLLKSRPIKTKEALKILIDLPKETQNEALKFMLYFLDINQLFLEALGTYDTNITLMVANASHKDPKEYLALLNKFDKIEDKSMRCYEINMHITRYPEALKHLIDVLIKTKSKETELQIVELIGCHKLYKHAIPLLPIMNEFVSLKEVIWIKYGDYLFLKRYYMEAGLCFSKALALTHNEEHLSAAIKCYLLANDWEKPLALITRHEFVSESTKEKCLEKLREHLSSEANYFKLAYTLNLADKTKTKHVEKLLDNGSWHLAEFYSSRCEQLYQEFFKNAKTTIPIKATEMITEYNNSLRDVKLQFDRLKDLIITYQSRKLVEYNPDNYISDSLSTIDGSETSSNASGSILSQRKTKSGASSIKTRTSGKSNSSHVLKQKRINLKQGSRNEDLALIMEIQKYIKEQKDNQDRAMNLSSALYDYCDYDLAVNLTQQTNDILLESHNYSKEISDLLWPNGPQYEQKYSLYKRFSELLSNADNNLYENVDFQVLIKPNICNLLCYQI